MSEIAKFKCPECNAVSDAEAWDKATEEAFTPPITEIESTDRDECSFICPSCISEVSGGAVERFTEQGEIERLKAELDSEKKHSELGWEQSGKWLDENGKLRDELDQAKKERDLWKERYGKQASINIEQAQLMDKVSEKISELIVQIAEKDKVLEWYREKDPYGGERARNVRSCYKKGDATDETV